ncbi:MAG: amidohydrolase family protein [candidate division NC10 bacterium]|nr:amidohydrolase family protein [candidate division NC10 bacterium]
MAPIVDSHLHVWDETAAGKAPGPMGPGNYSAQAQAPVELFMDYMDEAGVDKAVFVQPWLYHWDNSYMIESARRYPDRFRAVCVIDPRGPGAAAALKKWRAQGATGIRLRAYREGEGPTTGPWLGIEETMPLWEAIAETDTIVCVLWAGKDLARLHGVLRRFPSVRVVVDHLNNPVPKGGLHQPVFKALLELASLPTVSVKLSGFHHWCEQRYPYRDGMPFVEAAVKAFGADRCMWGSDFPHVLAGCGYVRNRNLLPREAKFLSTGQLDAIMGGTAERLWFG